MQRYILIRLVQAVVTLLVLSIAVFLSSHLTGDPGLYLLGPDDGLAEYEEMRKNLGLDKLGIPTDRMGRIEVDPVTLRTSVPSVYAVGDAIFGPMLAHKAEVALGDERGARPVHLAAQFGYVPVLEHLHSRGAEATAVDDGGMTPRLRCRGTSGISCF